ncbi:MAG: OmpA family protein [Candidatus Zixiibacteriota bacterium]
MRKFVVIICVLLFGLSAVEAAESGEPRYRFGISYGVGNISAPESPKFTFNHSFGLSAGLDGRHVLLSFSLLALKNYSDSSASGNFGFFADKSAAEVSFSSVRAGFDLDIRLKSRGTFRPFIGTGLGYLIWKIKDPIADTVLRGLDENDNLVDLSAAEMFIGGALGLEVRPSEKTAVTLRTSIDYLTGIGTSFNDETNNNRGRSIMRAGVTFSYLFGEAGRRREPLPPAWPSTETWETQDADEAKPKPAERDSDGDGVNDRYDDCPNTPTGAYVNQDGCPTDSDGDGILNGLDDCPQTPRSAIGFVDIYGCPIDSDFDGVPDFEDQCKDGPEGALVDEFGCPLDTDGDGIFDGLDDCPDTQPGVDVDARGCIDVSFIRKSIIVNVDYEPGSFEIDARTKERLQPLIKKLLILTHVKITINGYTDNIGPAEANQTVSQRRANRMRDWLVTQGIATERMTAVGKGETNFIASNQTAEGRARNRRLEFIFSE